MIDETAEFIGVALAACINLLDPDRIYLCGGMMKNGPEFLEKIRACTLRKQMHNAGRRVVILQGDPRRVERGARRGAGGAVLRLEKGKSGVHALNAGSDGGRRPRACPSLFCGKRLLARRAVCLRWQKSFLFLRLASFENQYIVRNR